MDEKNVLVKIFFFSETKPPGHIKPMQSKLKLAHTRSSNFSNNFFPVVTPIVGAKQYDKH